MASLDVFRFMSVRRVQRARGDASALVVPARLERGDVPRGSAVRAGTDTLRVLRRTGVLSREEARRWASEYLASPDFVADPATLASPVAALEQWLFDRGDAATEAEVVDALKRLVGMDPATLVGQADWQSDRRSLLLGMTALALLPGTDDRLRDRLLRLLCVVGLVERIARTPGTLADPEAVRRFLAGCVIELPGFVPVPGDDLARPPAVADLKVVRQRLKRYQVGEVAEIRNVLRGESLSRVHRRKDVREETTQVTTETELTVEQDNQSTERFEMQKEVSRVVSDDLHLEAGAEVSASYGPVTATVTGGFEANHAQEDSTRTATTYAREVIERAARRVRERSETQRTVRVQREVEETNTHGIDNSGATDHMVGVYRFVDKVYEAQLLNYGRRLLLEFVVPEPAAFVKHALARAAAPSAGGARPVAPEVSAREGLHRPGFGPAISPRPLRPSDLTAQNYEEWVARYFVRDVKPPPADTVSIGVAFDSPAQPETGITDATPARKVYKVNKDVTVPTGYAATHVRGTMHMSNWITDTLLTVGSTNIPLSEYRTGSGIAFDVELTPGISGGADLRLPIALLLENTWGYDLAAVVTCSLTADGLRGWQAETYEKIMTAYFELDRAWQERVAAEQVRAGDAVQGMSPARNRVLEREELRRNVVSLLEQHHFDAPPIAGEAIRTVPPEGFPEVDFAVARAERDYVQWFEQAFEWAEMTYALYPYYWGKKSSWPVEALRQDEDPLFASFLRAGAARVVVPVRPGFERAMALYLATGIAWNGTQVPQVGDPLFVSIVQEIEEQLDAGNEAVPEGPPWEVTLPTSLVILQGPGELPELPA